MPEAGVREKFVEDHARLRGKAEVLESIALRILRGDEDLGSALLLKGEEIRDHLVRHMDWEERELLPLLRQSGRSDIASGLVTRHTRHREHFEGDLLSLHNTKTQPIELTKHIVKFLRQLESDMQREEEDVLGALNPGPGRNAGSRRRHSS